MRKKYTLEAVGISGAIKTMDRDCSGKRSFLKKEYLSYAGIVLAFAYLLSASWLKLGSIIIDTFRDPWIAYRIVQGDVLYRDLHYLFGFLPPYSMALLFKLFGVHLYVFIYAGAVITLISAILIYRISRLFLGQLFSVLVAVIFLAVFAFEHYTYSGIFNFIFPYTIASTFFALFALFALYFFITFLREGNFTRLLLWAFFLYCAFLCRITLTFSVWLVFAAWAVYYALRERRKSIFVYIVLPPVVAFFSYLFFIISNGAANGFAESVINSIVYFSQSGNYYTFKLSGFRDFSENSVIILKATMLTMIVVTLFYAISAMLDLVISKKGFQIRSTILYTFLISLACGAFYYAMVFLPYPYQYRPLPLVLLAGIVMYFRRLRYAEGGEWRKFLSLLVLFSVGLILLLRIIMNAEPLSYGFFLAPVAVIGYYIFFANAYYSFLRTWLSDSACTKRYYTFLLMLFFVLWALCFTAQNHWLYRIRFVPVTARRGALYNFYESGKPMQDAIHYLQTQTPPDARLVVFPEGVGFNFLSARDNPMRYYTFIPSEIGMIGEDVIVRELDTNRIDYVMIVSRFTFFYDKKTFGLDYGRKLYSWILDNYRLDRVFGAYPFASVQFGIAIFKKK